MNARLAAVSFPDGQRSAGPVHRSIMAVDLEGSTMRTNPIKGVLRRVIYDLLERSLEAVAITGDRLEPLIDRGDGVLVLIRPHDDVPKTVVLGQLVPLLTALLAEYNARVPLPALRIRLRVVVHAGEVHEDGRGFYGEAIDVAIRLLDSPTVKHALKRTTGPVVLVVSQEIYAGVVRHGYVPVDAYSPLVWVRVGDRRHRGYVHIPAPAAARETAPGQRAPVKRPLAVHPGFRSSAIGHRQPVRSGHR